MKIDARTVGEIIKKLRTEKKLSQEVLSGLADISRSHLSMIEIGRKMPNLEIIIKISDALGIKPSELIRIVEQNIPDAEN